MSARVRVMQYSICLLKYKGFRRKCDLTEVELGTSKEIFTFFPSPIERDDTEQCQNTQTKGQSLNQLSRSTSPVLPAPPRALSFPPFPTPITPTALCTTITDRLPDTRAPSQPQLPQNELSPWIDPGTCEMATLHLAIQSIEPNHTPPRSRSSCRGGTPYRHLGQ